MRLFSIFSLFIFTLCVLLINGQSYKPNRVLSNPRNECQDACNDACEQNCGSTICAGQNADIVVGRSTCRCLCPVEP